MPHSRSNSLSMADSGFKAKLLCFQSLCVVFVAVRRMEREWWSVNHWRGKRRQKKQPTRLMASFPREGEQEALRDNSAGPADHSGGFRRTEGEWVMLLVQDYMGQPVRQRCPNKEIQPREWSGPSHGPLPLCSSFRRHRCSDRECELTQAAYESAKGGRLPNKVRANSAATQSPSKGKQCLSLPPSHHARLHLNFCCLHRYALPRGRGLHEGEEAKGTAKEARLGSVGVVDVRERRGEASRRGEAEPNVPRTLS